MFFPLGCIPAPASQHLCTRPVPPKRRWISRLLEPAVTQAWISRGSGKCWYDRRSQSKRAEITSSPKMRVNDINYRGSNSSYNIIYIPCPFCVRNVDLPLSLHCKPFITSLQLRRALFQSASCLQDYLKQGVKEGIHRGHNGRTTSLTYQEHVRTFCEHNRPF